MTDWKISAGAALVAALAVAGAAPAAAAESVRLTKAEIAARLAQTTDGLATSTLPTGEGGPVVVMAKREKTGDAEVHEGMNDVFVVHSGRASVLVGGKIEGHKLTTPGEWRGGKITGAKSYDIGPGDVLFIPAGLPHHVIVPAGETFTYMAFKSAK